MAQTFKGFVGKINTKTGTGRRGPWTLYSTKLQDERGEDSSDWLSFGFDKPNVSEGDYVKVTVEQDANGRDKVTEVKKLKNPPARAAARYSGTTSSDSASGGTTKQSSIHYQNSRTAAIEVVKLLVEQDALGDLPKTGTKPAQAKRFAIITAAIDKLTIQYFNDLETMRLTETVADAGALDTKPDADLPDSESGNEGEDESEEEQDDDEDSDD